MIQPIMNQISASKKSEKLADLCNLDFTRLHGKKILNFYVKDMNFYLKLRKDNMYKEYKRTKTECQTTQTPKFTN